MVKSTQIIFGVKLKIKISDKARSWLAEVGYDPTYGARPLRRAIEQYIDNPLSSRLLRGEFKPNDTILVDREADDLTFKVKRDKAAAKKNRSKQEKIAD